MSTNNFPDFILLSKIINRLKDNDYYRTFAKTLIMTNLPETKVPADEDLVKVMFHHFIQTDNLQIYLNDKAISPIDVQLEAERRMVEENAPSDKLIDLSEHQLEKLWENEIYINTKGLKKLYANKCIVFPNSLLKD